LFNFGDDILISTLIATVESNLRTSESWHVICTMDWAFTKPSRLLYDHVSCLTMHAYPT